MFLHSEHAVAPYEVEDSPTEAQALLAWIELPVFVELDPEGAPFNFGDGPLKLVHTELGEKSQDRFSRCAGEIQLYQHRLFLFMIWIQRDWVRLMRWDRRAVVVSSAFNYVEDPTRLLEFLRRFANSSPTQRGHDASVVLATRLELDALLRYEPRNRWERTYHAEMIQNLDIYPIRKVCTGFAYTVCRDVDALSTTRSLAPERRKAGKAVVLVRYRTGNILSGGIVTQITSPSGAGQNAMSGTALRNDAWSSSRTFGIHLALHF